MDIIYYFDRVWIYSMNDPTTIIQALPMEQLQQFSKSFEVKGKNAFSEFTKYQSWTDIIAPTFDCLKILFDHEHIFEDYRISHLEIAKDQSFETDKEADEETRNLINKTRKKWSRDHNVYDQREHHTFFDPPEDPGKFGTITGKDNSKFFGFRQYARISKVTDEPSLHQEFYIYNPKQIEKRTGIKEIGDLLAFDHQQWFEDQSKKYLITGETIDKIKLGKWLLNWNTKRKFTKRNFITMEIVAQQFIVYKNVYTYPSLVQYVKQWKKDINHKPGPKSQWDLQVLRLTNYSRFRT